MHSVHPPFSLPINPYRSLLPKAHRPQRRESSQFYSYPYIFSSSAHFGPAGKKLIILDEADNMTKSAQFALRRVIEKYTSNTRFCLICNYLNKIIPALQSRCTRFRFGPLESKQIKELMIKIAGKEGCKYVRTKRGML